MVRNDQVLDCKDVGEHQYLIVSFRHILTGVAEVALGSSILVVFRPSFARLLRLKRTSVYVQLLQQLDHDVEQRSTIFEVFTEALKHTVQSVVIGTHSHERTVWVVCVRHKEDGTSQELLRGLDPHCHGPAVNVPTIYLCGKRTACYPLLQSFDVSAELWHNARRRSAEDEDLHGGPT